MIFSKSSKVIGALSVYAWLGAARESNTTLPPCENNSHFRDGTYNSSGFVTVPGPRVNESYPKSKWTWGHYMGESTTGSRNNIWQTIGLKTSPPQNLADPSLPYTGCLVALTSLDESKIPSKHAQDDGSCSRVLGGCAADLLSQVEQAAMRLSGSLAGAEASCTNLLGSLSSDSTNTDCKGRWNEAIGTQFLPGTYGPRPNGTTCAINRTLNPGESDASDNAFFAWGGFGNTDAEDHTAYDEVLLTPLPIIVATWMKAPNGTKSGGHQTVSNERWANVQLLCVPANITQPGSRNLTQANTDHGNGGGRMGVGSGMFAIVGLSIMAGLVL